MPNDGLRAVNVYILEDGDSIVLIDAGVAVAESRTHLVGALRSLDRDLEDLSRLLVTHVHYDHYSQALDLRRELGVPVSLGRGEQPSLRTLADRSLPPFTRQVGLLRTYGAPELARAVEERLAGEVEEPLVGLPDTWLDDEAEIELTGRPLIATHTPGHTQGHFVFSDVEHGLLFAGDHVLPQITPSIGFEPEPGTLPLADYLRSLRRVREMPDTRLLPAHGPTTQSVHRRIDELLEHHRTRLSQCLQTVSDGAVTGLDAAEQLLWTSRQRGFTELDTYNRMLAVLETGAHLELLAARGDLTRTTDNGVLVFSPA